ncbi:hypothetical protein [Salipaludibacillus neizhouensis]|nr:hypothetical protein [Salipaludibacillus neizhouensis]
MTNCTQEELMDKLQAPFDANDVRGLNELLIREIVLKQSSCLM